MKKAFLILPFIALAVPAAAQHAEITARAGLGLLQFGGSYTVRSTAINYNSSNSGYANSPYGSRLGAGWVVGARAARVGRRHGLLAFDLGYEWLQSRTTVNVLNYYDGASNTPRAATGAVGLQTRSLTVFVGVGHRFKLPLVDLDVLAGPEVAYVSGFHDKGSGTFDGSATWALDYARTTDPLADARLRLDVTALYHRLGFNTSYSYGVTNYVGNIYGVSYAPTASTRILRLGLAYRLRKAD